MNSRRRTVVPLRRSVFLTRWFRWVASVASCLCAPSESIKWYISNVFNSDLIIDTSTTCITGCCNTATTPLVVRNSFKPCPAEYIASKFILQEPDTDSASNSSLLSFKLPNGYHLGFPTMTQSVCSTSNFSTMMILNFKDGTYERVNRS